MYLVWKLYTLHYNYNTINFIACNNVIINNNVIIRFKGDFKIVNYSSICFDNWTDNL